jgi:purine-cytosine permease-like protein
VPPLFLSPLLAAQSATDAFKRVPKQMWINIAICVVAVFMIVRLWRTLKQLNEFAPYLVAALAFAMIFFYWVYERSEPAFLSPFIEHIAPFFPSKFK